MDDALRRVRECSAGVAEAQRRLQAAVASARAAGAAWRQVGEALGVTRQAAQARFRARHDRSAG